MDYCLNRLHPESVVPHDICHVLKQQALTLGIRAHVYEHSLLIAVVCNKGGKCFLLGYGIL